MSRYINREEALSFPFANGQYDHKNADENFILGCESYKEWLENLPTADVIHVVRCKDCIHRRKGGFSRSETDGWTVTFTTPCDLGDEGFCSKGEKVAE